ncbi:NAD(+) diphosphatase [Microbacterium mitrae]|uniref:NAD(+) diphosphatase n=1 Tax=Microbacterium mitrae TaxID=664640 RepID=A0A5C8HP42_9MICO|nr:NAD(+) diphosphatase [Microbacterium mitrae]TXK05910.1 NAD(+) diphosphatase [Microbacterium mitrae]
MSTEEIFLPLARSVLDRCAERRTEPELLDTLREDPATRVVVIRGDETLFTTAGTLALRSPHAVEGEATWGFLGAANGLNYVVCAPGDGATVDEIGGQWQSLRVRGGDIPEFDAGVFVEALCLARWYIEAPFCAACGSATVLAQAGWMRECPQCSRQHFPRTDPAVIVAVVDGDRILLGSNALWAGNRFSCFAGFVEAGESLEAAVHREVSEEAGVAVHDVRYFGSQAWPYPRSLMLGFFAEVTAAELAHADGEEILEVRWFTKAEVRASYAGETDVILPGSASIAHALISSWAQS